MQFKNVFSSFPLAVALIGWAVPAMGIVCADSSYATVLFSRVFTGAYRTGQPYDVVTIDPSGGETFAAAGIGIQVYLKNCNGAPLAGVPAQEIVLFNSFLCMCPGGNIADAPTDLNGRTQFTGALRAGGCANGLSVLAEGVLIANLPIRTNGCDTFPANCDVDSEEFGRFAHKFPSQVGQPNYSICSDYTKDGYIDSSDLALLASRLGGMCH